MHRAGDASLALLLAGATVLLGFEAGGYFADTTGWAAAAFAVVLGARALRGGKPPGGLTRPLLVAMAALALLALWTLASGAWSGSWGRALIEFDRTLLYLVALLVFAGASSPEWTLRRLPESFALAALVLCASALVIRTLPEAWPFELPPVTPRMEYPLGYENALGALAALGIVFALHVGSWREEHPVVRILAAAALPVLAAGLILTFSRGGLVAAGVGVAAYLVLGLSRGALAMALATVIPVALAVHGAYGADLLGSETPRSPAALEEGEDIALLVVAAAVTAGGLRALLLPLERRLPPLRWRRVDARVVVPLLGLAVAGAVAIAATTGGGSPAGDEGPREALARDRLTTVDLQNQARPDYWRVSLDAFADRPLEGHGAGEFGKLWARERPSTEDVNEGHSLYLETLAELGAVGGVLLLLVLGSAMAPFAIGIGGRERPLSAAFLAAAAAWLLHAGLDWDWEMPVLTLWLFAAAGSALAAAHPLSQPPARPPAPWPARLAVAAACVLAAVTPAAVALSQGRLDRAVTAFMAGDCAETERAARDAISALRSRAEAYALLAYCSARSGQHDLSLVQIGEATERDPDNWKLVYGTAVVRGAAGVDPRPAARAARRLNPRDPLTQAAIEGFSTSRPRAWRRAARDAPLPLLSD